MKFSERLKKLFPLSWPDAAITASAWMSATLLCILIQDIDQTGSITILLYVLAVVIVARLTNGYFFGLITTLISVFSINYFFTKPYFMIDFSKPRHAVAFVCMLIITLVISTLTSRITKSERQRYEMQAETMKGNLLRAISHDLRTPLMTISASADLLKQHPEMDEEQKQDILSDITAESEWMIRMVENLLSITRINSQSSEIKKTMEVACDVISSAVLKFRKRFPDMEIHIELPEDVNTVPMDAMLIEQVLMNLMQNVVLHGKTATRIDIRLYYKLGYAVYEVKDNGCGIDAKKLPHLFIDNGDDDSGASDKWRGMGIGLSVCKTIINVHHGDIMGTNLPEGGAVFRFRLPLKEVTQ